MPDSTLPPVTISGLPQAAQATINDQIEVNQSGTSRSVTIGQIQAVPYSGGLILSGHLVGTTAFFTGEIHAATPIYPDNDTSVATTAYVTQAVMGAVGGTNPIGPAGGDLAGLYPNPTLKSGLTLNGTTTLTGNVVANNGYVMVDRSGDATGAQLYLRGDTDQIASLNFQTAAGGNNRWAIFKNNTSESGSNAGSNLVIFSYDDAGASLASALTITRSTSAVTLAGGLTGTTATFSGTVTTTGGSLVTSGGNVTIDRTSDAVSAFLFIQADNGFPSGVALRTTTGNRWLISKNSVSETGSSVGSDYNLAAYDDTATAIGNYQIVTRATGYTSIGLNVTPLSRLHVKGAGQVVATIDTSTNLGNALFLQSTGGAGGDGGMILFGASAGAGAAIKGHGISNSNNTTADVVISTRRITTDVTLTETARFKNDGSTILAGALTGTTATMSGSITSNSSVSCDLTGKAQNSVIYASSDVGNTAGVMFRTGVLARWQIYKNVGPEGGSNAGSDFMINAYNDAGTSLGPMLTITRATGAVTLPGALTSLSGTAVGAGANTQAFIKASSTANLGIYYGTGVPGFSAAKGSIYSCINATTTTTRLYVNTDGATTWANLTTSV